MFYLQFQILVLIANTIAIHGYNYRHNYYDKRRAGDGIKLNDHVSENREELRRIIEMLNGHLRDEKRQRDLDSNRLRVNAADSSDDGVVDKQVDRLTGLLGRLQRSYDDRLYKEPVDLQNSRIHVIANPEVLEEFKRRIRARHHSTSSDDSDTNLSSGLTYYKTKGGTNHAFFTDEDNVSSDVDKYQFVAPAKSGNMILVMRKSRLGAPPKVKKEDAGSNEMYEGSKISWGQVEASHEKFVPKKEENFSDLEIPKEVAQKPHAYPKKKKPPPVSSDEAPPLKPVRQKRIRDVEPPPRSSESWSKQRIKEVPQWDEVEKPRPYKSARGSHGSSRTSIPYIGHQNIYDDKK